MKALSALLALALGTVVLSAQTPAQPALTLEKARALALEHSAALKDAGINVNYALLTEKGQIHTWLPGIAGSVKAGIPFGSQSQSAYSGPVSGSVGLSMTQTVWDGGLGAVLLAIDRLSTSSARAAARGAYYSTLQSADDAYYAVLAAQDAVDAAASDLDTAKASLDLAQAKRDAGIITKLDLLQAQANTAAAETTLDQDRWALRTAAATLASLIQAPLPLSVVPVDFSTYETLIGRLSGLDGSGLDVFASNVLASAEKNNPALAAAIIASRKAALGVDQARTAWWPSVSASLTGAWSFGGGAPSQQGGSLSLGATIPLGVWNTALGVVEARLATSQADNDLAEERRTLELGVRTSIFSWASASRAITSSQKALEYAQANYDSVFESFKLSLVTAADLTTAAQLVSTDQTAFNQAHYGFLQSMAALRTLAGVESDDMLIGMVP